MKRQLLVALACALLAAPHGRAELALGNTRALAFGGFVAGSGGTVAISANGMRTRGGGVLLLNARGGNSATFTVSDIDPAHANNTYIVTLPDNGTVTLTSGGNSMAVNNFVSNPEGMGMLTAGSQTLHVGATLTVGANQPIGNYSGNFSVTVNFQ